MEKSSVVHNIFEGVFEISILLIILGSIFSFFGVIGFITVAIGTAPLKFFITYLILFAIGAGLIHWGNVIRKNKKLFKQQMLDETSVNHVISNTVSAPAANVTDNFDDPKSIDGMGILMINWKRKAMAFDAFTILSVDNERVNILSFLSDSKMVIPLKKGLHNVSAVLMQARKAKTEIEIAAGQCLIFELEYSRASGGIKFLQTNTAESFDFNTLPQTVRNFSLRKKFIRTISDHLDQGGSAIKELTDTRAVLFKFSKTANMMLNLFSWGIIPALIRAAANKIVIEMQPDGSITTRIAGKDGI